MRRRRARAFGFQLAAYDPFVKPEVFESLGVKSLTKEGLFQQAGILSMHLPSMAETRHFVGREQLARMSRGAIIVNTARGALIDTVALAEALHAGSLAGAGLDVFEAEPLEMDHPLRTAPNTLLTSHTAWYSEQSVSALQTKAAKEIVRGLRGEPLLNVVNGVKPHLPTA